METKDQLEKFSDYISRTVMSCMEIFFNAKPTCNEKWATIDRLENSFDHIFSLGCSNERYQANLVLAIDQPSFDTFIGADADTDDIIDMFGEIANNICGMLSDDKEFRQVFGVLRQAVPMYSTDCVYFPKVSSIHGRAYVGDSWLYFGFSARVAA